MYEGEAGTDAGGLYRESLTLFARDLMSNTLQLLIPTPNTSMSVGTHRDCWMLNPLATSSDHVNMFEFLGKVSVSVSVSVYVSMSMSESRVCT